MSELFTSSGPLHVIFDDSALVALGRGNSLASALIVQAHPDPIHGDGHQDEPAIARVYAAACALVEADRSRPGTGPHAAALPNLEVVPLDLPGALQIAAAAEWAFSHTLYAAHPSMDIPDGAIVATARPERWTGQPVRVLDLTP